MSDPINPYDYKIPTPGKKYLERTHTMLLVSYFPRSGASLLGYLLTAHRNMIVANEPARHDENLYGNVPFRALLTYILYMERIMYERAKPIDGQSVTDSETSSSASETRPQRYLRQKQRYVIVPNQWQGCYDLLNVIGVKNSLPMAESLLDKDTWRELVRSIKKMKIHRFKFIHTVRNPYDMITTDTIYWKRNEGLRKVTEADVFKMLDYRVKVLFPNLCKASSRVLKLFGPENIFINRHEDLVANPTEQLRKLCEFLDVPAFTDYLTDCASVVHKTANQSRHNIHWDVGQKKAIEKLISKYDFLRGYSWDA